MGPDDIKASGELIAAAWAGRKVLGPTVDHLGQDLARLYDKGRDKLLEAAAREIGNTDDGKQANLRVARDVLWSGSFSTEEICAEYFGGILASSRTSTGSDDGAIQFVGVTKSLSAKQLHLHYVTYRAIILLMVKAGKAVNVGVHTEVQANTVAFSTLHLTATLGINPFVDLTVLHRVGLIQAYSATAPVVSDGSVFPHTIITPSPLGVLLYAAAQNRLGEIVSFDKVDFGDFPDVQVPSVYAADRESLMQMLGLRLPGSQ